ncbi:hypothetical protein CC80DRAFT_199923 [Byssothecium circinans]|uniref:Uncharacterized protein n=1 Tax=Byssothecium circinans TaxID=147558 RepID=A0A6A5ULG6_9PLEO|nr:hypothetical protein CC80DRAFT_199923 [Byssothecium circinans]
MHAGWVMRLKMAGYKEKALGRRLAGQQQQAVAFPWHGGRRFEEDAGYSTQGQHPLVGSRAAMDPWWARGAMMYYACTGGMHIWAASARATESLPVMLLPRRHFANYSGASSCQRLGHTKPHLLLTAPSVAPPSHAICTSICREIPHRSSHASTRCPTSHVEL